MKNILITGIAGFIGSRLAEHLLLKKYSITGIDNLKTGSLENIPKNANFVIGDCADDKVYKNPALLDRNFDAIIHLAGQSSGEISFDNPAQDLNDNCMSTLRLLDFARRISCKKFIFASSMSVYGSVKSNPVSELHASIPLSMYAVGKIASENYLRLFQRYGISSVSLRLFNVYGPGQNMSNHRQGMASIYMAQALSKGNIVVKGSPDRFRDLVYIDDVTRVIERFIDHEFDGSKVYNVCTGVKTKVSDLIEFIKEALNQPSISVKYIEGTPGDQFGIVGDNTNLMKAIGDTTFVDIKCGIKRFAESLQAN